MSAVTDNIGPWIKTAAPDSPPTAIVLIDTGHGWRWLGIPLKGHAGLSEGWELTQRAALEEAMLACPGWQMVRVA